MVHLDLVRRRPRPGIAAWVALAAGAVTLLTAVAWDGIAAAEAEESRAAMEAKLKELKQAVADKKPVGLRMDSGQVTEEMNKAVQVSANLNSPWSALFETLEREIERPVGLLALDMDAARGNFALSAEAKNFDEMLAFLRFLQGCDQFADVVLHTHQVNQQDREKPIRFRVTARWVAKS